MMKRRYIAPIALVLFGVGAFFYQPAPEITDLPEMVLIKAGQYPYRLAGQFRIGTRVVNAPVETRVADADFEVMKYLVSEADYGACVADGGCFVSTNSGSLDLPQIDVSYADAIAYAEWYSKKTRQNWRLPTDEEWMRSAGDRFVEDVIEDATDGADPAKRWLAEYLQEVEIRGEADLDRHPLGSFGENDMGVADISGNVWEWTDSCFQSGILAEDGAIDDLTDYCGVRAAQGKHRAYIIDFIRDAKVGGCAVGLPPDYLGFRLVRDS